MAVSFARDINNGAQRPAPLSEAFYVRANESFKLHTQAPKQGLPPNAIPIVIGNDQPDRASVDALASEDSTRTGAIAKSESVELSGRFFLAALGAGHSDGTYGFASDSENGEFGEAHLKPGDLSTVERAKNLIRDGQVNDAIKLIADMLEKADPEAIMSVLEDADEVLLMLYSLGYKEESLELLSEMLNYASMNELLENGLEACSLIAEARPSPALSPPHLLSAKPSSTPSFAPALTIAPPAPGLAA